MFHCVPLCLFHCFSVSLICWINLSIYLFHCVPIFPNDIPIFRPIMSHHRKSHQVRIFHRPAEKPRCRRWIWPHAGAMAPWWTGWTPPPSHGMRYGDKVNLLQKTFPILEDEFYHPRSNWWWLSIGFTTSYVSSVSSASVDKLRPLGCVSKRVLLEYPWIW